MTAAMPFPGTRKGSKILVAEAERHIARLIQVNLERAGYRVVTAPDGKEALMKAESEQPDLILLGALSPPLDADEVLERLRASEATKHLRVVMVPHERRGGGSRRS
ncbi:MAG TPA: response regulator [Armatimonadota bacterium]|nr:response regulator [Armatimonadota bacterium]